ncbi:MAG: hypothetical protein E6370_16850 [Clostridiales bacterium]|nr:hypothetical protein [Clostridiales bacterium]
MSRKQRIFDFMFTSIIRGILMLLIVFMAIGSDYLGIVPIPIGLIFAIIIIGLYIYSVIDEAILNFNDEK